MLYGYCTSARCCTRYRAYITKKGKKGYKTESVPRIFITEEKKQTKCPHCGYELLFISRKPLIKKDPQEAKQKTHLEADTCRSLHRTTTPCMVAPTSGGI
jgi:hypothetical protein